MGNWVIDCAKAANRKSITRLPSLRGTLLWRPLLVYLAVAAGTTTAIAVVAASNGWTVRSPEWGLLATVAMWAPAAGRFLASRTVDRGGFFTSAILFAAMDVPLTFLWAFESYRARSLWPAVFFHSFHNTVSQWLFPKFFAGGDNELWLGEGGLLPAAGYVVLGIALYLWMRRRRLAWQTLSRAAEIG